MYEVRAIGTFSRTTTLRTAIEFAITASNRIGEPATIMLPDGTPWAEISAFAETGKAAITLRLIAPTLDEMEAEALNRHEGVRRVKGHGINE